MSATSGLRELQKLASLYGVQTHYQGADQQQQSSSVESLVAVLQGLGASLAGLDDSFTALRARKQELWRRSVEPVTVAWDGQVGTLPVRLPRQLAEHSLSCLLTLESGEEESWKCSLADLSPSESASIEGVDYVVKNLPFSKTLPPGYHWLTLEIPRLPATESLIISAPMRAYSPFDNGTGPTWGVFLPLYALRRRNSKSAGGDFSDLAAMAKWVSNLGGSFVATLPLLAAFLDEPFAPSPYTPASRLLWNEFYIDVSRLPELEHCPDARAWLASDGFSRELEHLQQLPLVDYQRGMALKRQVLEKLARCCHEHLPDRRQALQEFLGKYPTVADYARFRATVEKHGASWHSWPHRLQQGDLSPGDYDEKVMGYHCYVQWLAHQQVRALSRDNGDQGAGLYLDLPLGVHPDGYDVWRRPDLFVREFSVGAPPDALAAVGQNWGFPPLHPEKLRLSGYDYFRDYLRHHLEAAGLLRIDHVMGLHRLFWIPPGMDATGGTYVCYPNEELYAILTLESHRHKSAIVGEDLGTVPSPVRPAMQRHGIYGMYVSYFEMSHDSEQAFKSVSSNALASVNTHDTPAFAAFWQGLDVGLRQELGHQSEDGGKLELAAREKSQKAVIRFLQSQKLLRLSEDDPQAVLRAILSWLSQSQAPMVLINLEDLWLETEPQNVPGTESEHPNWQHKARYSLEEFSQMPQVVEVLREFNSLRKLAQQRR